MKMHKKLLNMSRHAGKVWYNVYIMIHRKFKKLYTFTNGKSE